MLFAYLLPGLSLYFNRRRALGILLLLLQGTLIAWVVGAVLAVRNLHYQRRRRGESRRAVQQAAKWYELAVK